MKILEERVWIKGDVYVTFIHTKALTTYLHDGKIPMLTIFEDVERIGQARREAFLKQLEESMTDKNEEQTEDKTAPAGEPLPPILKNTATIVICAENLRRLIYAQGDTNVACEHSHRALMVALELDVICVAEDFNNHDLKVRHFAGSFVQIMLNRIRYIIETAVEKDDPVWRRNRLDEAEYLLGILTATAHGHGDMSLQVKPMVGALERLFEAYVAEVDIPF